MTRDPPVKSEFTVTLNYKVSLEALVLNVAVALLLLGLKGDLVYMWSHDHKVPRSTA